MHFDEFVVAVVVVETGRGPYSSSSLFYLNILKVVVAFEAFILGLSLWSSSAYLFLEIIHSIIVRTVSALWVCDGYEFCRCRPAAPVGFPRLGAVG